MRGFLRSLLIAFSLFSGLTVLTPASAGNNILGEQSPGVSIDWSGLYLGLHGGYGWSKQDTGLGSDISVDGWLAGGHVGLQRQFDRWVFGIEASITGGDLDGSKTIAGMADVKATVSDILTITGRLGYAWRDRLFYVKGGYASADVDLSISTFWGAFSGHSRVDGWTAGFGFERQITHNVSIGLEYNYIDLGAKSFTFAGSGGPLSSASTAVDCPPPKPVSGSFDPDGLHTVLARVSFRLGSEPEHVPYK